MLLLLGNVCRIAEFIKRLADDLGLVAQIVIVLGAYKRRQHCINRCLPVKIVWRLERDTDAVPHNCLGRVVNVDTEGL
jgi:hypothetical protein